MNSDIRIKRHGGFIAEWTDLVDNTCSYILYIQNDVDIYL